MKPSLRYLRRIAFSLLLVSSVTGATEQEPDLLVVDGVAANLYRSPLAPYLLQHPDALPASNHAASNNHRGYLAIWEIADDALVLTRVDQTVFAGEPPRHTPATRNIIGLLFAGKARVVADWYCGELVYPQGQPLSRTYRGNGSIHASYLLFHVRNGRVVRRLELDADGLIAYRNASSAASRATPEFPQDFACPSDERGRGDPDLADPTSGDAAARDRPTGIASP